MGSNWGWGRLRCARRIEARGRTSIVLAFGGQARVFVDLADVGPLAFALLELEQATRDAHVEIDGCCWCGRS